MAYERNIFINCPFDDQYKPILKAIVFTIVHLDFNPLLSETVNSGESRVSQITSLISKSRYSIHDLSRMESSKKNELARFNMPFELGLDFGCKTFGKTAHQSKCLLILDKLKYRYQRSISDLSGNDIAIHNDEPADAVRQVRNWIYRIMNTKIDSANRIWLLYSDFTADFYNIAKTDRLSDKDIEQMPWDEYVSYIKQWLKSFP